MWAVLCKFVQGKVYTRKSKALFLSHYISAIGGRLYPDDMEAELEPGSFMWWTVNNLQLRDFFKGILEVIGDICDTNIKLVCGSNGNNQM